MQRLLGAAMAFGFVLAGCAHGRLGADASSPTPAATSPGLAAGVCHDVPLERSFCTALTLEAPKTTLRLAIADTPARRAHGLTGVRKVPAGEGMLFAFPEAGNAHHDFWMKGTPVGLDMVFIGADGTVGAVFAGVPASAPGASEATIARRTGVGKFVVELAAGGASAAGLRPGLVLDMPVTVTE